MRRDEFERLADLEFDGRLDASGRRGLEALAAGDPELGERLKDLGAARHGLAGAGLEPLPAGLHEALIGAAGIEGRGRSGRVGWLSFLSAAIQTRPVFALGGAVAAGLAIGALGLALLAGGPRPIGDLAPGTSASLPPAPPAVSTTTLEQGGARVTLTARRRGGETIVRLDARDATPATVTLAWDPAASRLVGLRWAGPHAPSFAPAPGHATLRMPEAAGIELSFEEIAGDGSAVRATLAAGGGEHEATLRLPR